MSKLFQDHQLMFFEDRFIEKHLEEIKDVDAISVFACVDVKKSVIDKLPNLKLITARSTGFDNIDCKYAGSKKIVVSNVPEYGSNTVAEFAFSLLLNVTRHVYKFSENSNNENYSIKGLRGTDIFGKVMGVIGAGKIGKNVIRIARGFGMKVLVYDKYSSDDLAFELGFDYVDLDYLLSYSDVISLHVPYNPETHHIINLNNIDKIKKGAVLINTARGGLIENEALVKALDSDIVLYAGLDVIAGDENELIHGKGNKTLQKIIAREDVIFTPHVAYYTKEAERRIWQTTVDNINAFMAGVPTNQVIV